MPVAALLGLQWGDEGKGKCTDYLASGFDIVVRCQGGANAGHSVEAGENNMITHLLPAAVLQKQVELVIGNGVVIDLWEIIKEINEAENLSPGIKERIKISKNSHIVLPFHKYLDQKQEENRKDSLIGTTGRGIGPCYSDKALRIGIRAGLLFYESVLTDFFSKFCDQHEISSKDKDYNTAYLLGAISEVSPLLIDSQNYLNRAFKEGKKILLEGAQGALLDIDHGTYPYVTSSNTTIGGLISGSGLSPFSLDRVIGLVKAYTTRVGEGPFPTEDDGISGQRMRATGREFGATTGRPRKCGWLDLVAVKHAIEINGVTEIILTKVDVLSQFEKIYVAVKYSCKGEEISYFPTLSEELLEAKPVYIELEGWEQEIRKTSNRNKLPANFSKYLDFIEEYLDTPIALVSYGPKREEMIIF
ncbi:MAG: adenylosuccinate synthase [Candidatus Coatesbacteria bacterium]|nr:adenylosuccinate synthase [Candidatus Coatesbacteria bacterium]